MAISTIIALFQSRADAQRASQRLRELGLSCGSLHLSAEGCRLQVVVRADRTAAASAAISEANATNLHIEREDPPLQNWMRHHNGRIAGTGAPPGHEDAEAGDAF